MSAYIVSNETINCIVNGMIDNRVIATMSAQEVGQLLLDQNYRSVNYRYKEDDKPHKFEFERKGVALEIGGTPVLYSADEMYTDSQVYGCVSCWKYQSCEDPNHESSWAWKYVRDLEYKLIEKAYPDAPWGL